MSDEPTTWRTEHITDPATGLTLCKQQPFTPARYADCVRICSDCAAAAKLLK